MLGLLQVPQDPPVPVLHALRRDRQGLDFIEMYDNLKISKNEPMLSGPSFMRKMQGLTT